MVALGGGAPTKGGRRNGVYTQTRSQRGSERVGFFDFQAWRVGSAHTKILCEKTLNLKLSGNERHDLF